jgi:hypothetical protein
MARGRPRRGDAGPNVIVSGDPEFGQDTGTREPQGGARALREEFRESGDLEAREFGVPQADIPGGIRHFVNPESHPVETAAKPQRPADYHKYHGVPSDDGLYEPTPDETTIGEWPAPERLPPGHDAVPVYIVERGAGERSRRVAATDTLTLPPIGSDPARICNRDDSRDEIMLLCTDAANDVLFSDQLASLAAATAAAHVGCAFLSHNATTYTRIATQGELWATSAAASASHVSVVIITSVPA